MEATASKLGDDRIEVKLTVSSADVSALVEQLSVGDEPVAAASAGTPRYCCVCSNGDKKTIKANGDIAAFFKCLDRCGTEFSLSSGRCKD